MENLDNKIVLRTTNLLLTLANKGKFPWSEKDGELVADNGFQLKSTHYNLSGDTFNEILSKVLRNTIAVLAAADSADKNPKSNNADYQARFAEVKAEFVEFLKNEDFPYVLQA